MTKPHGDLPAATYIWQNNTLPGGHNDNVIWAFVIQMAEEVFDKEANAHDIVLTHLFKMGIFDWTKPDVCGPDST